MGQRVHSIAGPPARRSATSSWWARRLVPSLLLTCFVAGVGCADAALARAPHDAIRIEVSLDAYEMRVLERGRTQLRFDISAGMPSTPTPTGGFTLRKVISNPSFNPGPQARRRGAKASRASSKGPLGVAKIPFQGSFLIHAGEDALAMGKPMTLGCVGLTDDSMRSLLHWLDERGALARGRRDAGGQLHHALLRPTYLRIR